MKEQTESRIVYDKTKADSFISPADGSRVFMHRAYPYLNDLFVQMDIYAGFPDAEKDTCCMIYIYLGDELALVPYLPSAVTAYTKALAYACESENTTVLGEIPDLVYKIAKCRNIIARDIYMAENAALLSKEDGGHIYDDCADIDAKGKMKAADVKKLISEAAKTARSTLIAHPSEHTAEYADLIYDMNETLYAAFDDELQKSDDFPYAFWAAKKMYLRRHGIVWESPAKLNRELRH